MIHGFNWRFLFSLRRYHDKKHWCFRKFHHIGTEVESSADNKYEKGKAPLLFAIIVSFQGFYYVIRKGICPLGFLMGNPHNMNCEDSP